MKISGTWRDVYKDPVTDPGKQSKRGRLILTRERGTWETMNINRGFDWANVLKPVYRNGELLQEITFAEVRANSNQPALD